MMVSLTDHFLTERGKAESYRERDYANIKELLCVCPLLFALLKRDTIQDNNR